MASPQVFSTDPVVTTVAPELLTSLGIPCAARAALSRGCRTAASTSAAPRPTPPANQRWRLDELALSPGSYAATWTITFASNSASPPPSSSRSASDRGVEECATAQARPFVAAAGLEPTAAPPECTTPRGMPAFNIDRAAAGEAAAHVDRALRQPREGDEGGLLGRVGFNKMS